MSSNDNIVPLLRPTCPCGWKPPRKFSIDGIYAFQIRDLRVFYNCPECDRTLETLMPKEVNEEENV